MPSSSLSLGHNVHALVCVYSLSLACSPRGHCAFSQKCAQTLLSMFISRLSPQRSPGYLQQWMRRGEAAFVPAWAQPACAVVPCSFGWHSANIAPKAPLRSLKLLIQGQDWLVPGWNLGLRVEEDRLPYAAQFLQALMKSPHYLAQNPTVVPSGSLGPVQNHKGVKGHLAGGCSFLNSPASVPPRASPFWKPCFYREKLSVDGKLHLTYIKPSLWVSWLQPCSLHSSQLVSFLNSL